MQMLGDLAIARDPLSTSLARRLDILVGAQPVWGLVIRGLLLAAAHHKRARHPCAWENQNTRCAPV
jgi:hypothetical protein